MIDDVMRECERLVTDDARRTERASLFILVSAVNKRPSIGTVLFAVMVLFVVQQPPKPYFFPFKYTM
jgi:hypothetical protein